jgi:hypothetical protein
MNPHKITVDIDENGRHACRPTRTPAKPGDKVLWTLESKASVSFRGRTPFVEGEGPFPPGSVSTVKSGEFFLNDHEEFVPDVEGAAVEGVIIIDKGN